MIIISILFFSIHHLFTLWLVIVYNNFIIISIQIIRDVNITDKKQMPLLRKLIRKGAVPLICKHNGFKTSTDTLLVESGVPLIRDGVVHKKDGNFLTLRP